MSEYGIWITIQHFACENGGDDIKGTKEEMEILMKSWIEDDEHPLPPNVTYEVRLYKTGDLN